MASLAQLTGIQAVFLVAAEFRAGDLAACLSSAHSELTPDEQIQVGYERLRAWWSKRWRTMVILRSTRSTPLVTAQQRWLAALLSLCLIPANVPAAPKPDLGQPDYVLDAQSGKGLMIVAMTRPWFRSGHPKNARWMLSYQGPPRGAKSGPIKRLVLEHENYFTGRNILGEFGDDIFGVVFAVELPAGNYTLKGWYLDGNTTAFNLMSAGAKALPFTITSGRATYVGHLHMTLETGKNLFGIEGLRDASVTLADGSETDLPIFLRKYPKVTREQIDVSVTLDPTWQSGPTRKQNDTTPIFVPTR
jgi:hypothetical protein